MVIFLGNKKSIGHTVESAETGISFRLGAFLWSRVVGSAIFVSRAEIRIQDLLKDISIGGREEI
jgi:hypothetical protein